MAEQARSPAIVRSPQRSAATSAAWKSGLLASGIGAVLLGWALLVRAEGPSNSSSVALVQAQSSVLIHEAPTRDHSEKFSRQSSSSRFAAPSLPQAPVFQRPITRSRGS